MTLVFTAPPEFLVCFDSLAWISQSACQAAPARCFQVDFWYFTILRFFLKLGILKSSKTVPNFSEKFFNYLVVNFVGIERIWFFGLVAEGLNFANVDTWKSMSRKLEKIDFEQIDSLFWTLFVDIWIFDKKRLDFDGFDSKDKWKKTTNLGSTICVKKRLEFWASQLPVFSVKRVKKFVPKNTKPNFFYKATKYWIFIKLNLLKWWKKIVFKICLKNLKVKKS